VRIATFNLQNMRLRAGHLSGARDGDTDEAPDAATDRADRRLTAQVIRDLGADVVVLQEVFDQATLDHFHDNFLVPAGVAPYPCRVCLPGNDGRGQELAILARATPAEIVSHAHLQPADLGLDVPPGERAETPIFRRDCLRVDLAGLTVFACHFKAPYPDPAAAWPVRHLEAQAVRKLVEARFDKPEAAMWLIAGDLNDPVQPGREPATAPLRPPFSVSLMDRRPRGERWSYFDAWSGLYGRPDKLLASPALARAFADAVPEVIREGLGLEAHRHTGAHLPDVGRHRPHASDHAAIVVEFPGL
jgi:endonuclease/exonuclease/phosphatase family metal-dependent hydrolase